MPHERTPLLGYNMNDPHEQFCMLAGVPPSSKPDKHAKIGPKTLYGRATHQYRNAKFSHAFMAAFSNSLLLAQVVLGATLTALGASESSHILITIFGVFNTIIAGLVAYLKSRGQPMRSRMYRDDLERVVDEIENSEIMWLGIAENIHGYDDIDVGDKVTVRSEVARLTRLYERAIRSNMMNNPDNYLLGAGQDGAGTALRARPTGTITVTAGPLPSAAPEVPAAAQPAPAPGPAADPDESPASAPPKPPTPPPKPKEDVKLPAEDDPKAESSKDATKVTKPAEEPSKEPSKPTPPTNDSKATLVVNDPDASPATTDPVPKPKEDTTSAPKPVETPKPSTDPANGGE